jgi:hypothetical protein
VERSSLFAIIKKNFIGEVLVRIAPAYARSSHTECNLTCTVITAAGVLRKKRGSEHQLTVDEDPDALVNDEAGTWKAASEDELKKRKIFKAPRRGAAALTEESPAGTTAPTPASPASPAAVAAAPTVSSWPAFTFNLPKKDQPEATKATTATTADNATSTPKKDANPWPAFSFTAPSQQTQKGSPIQIGGGGATATVTSPVTGGGFKFAFGTTPASPAGGAGATPAPFTEGFKFTPLQASATPPDMQTNVAAPSAMSFDSKTASLTQQPLKVFGKDIEPPKQPVLKSSFSFTATGSTAATTTADGGEGEGEGDGEGEEGEGGIPARVAPPAEPPASGEEGEETLFNERCKLFEFDTKVQEWVVRGIGRVKLNQQKEDKTKSRLIFRTEPAFRVVLNTAIVAGLPATLGKRPRLLNVTVPSVALIREKEKESAADDTNSSADAKKKEPESALTLIALQFAEEAHPTGLKEKIDLCIAAKTAASAAK